MARFLSKWVKCDFMKKIVIAVVWTIFTVIVFALSGCGEVTATKDAGGFWCLGLCAQKTIAVEVKVEQRVKQ